MAIETVLLVGVAALATSAMSAVLGFGGGMVLLAVLLVWVEPVVAIPLHAAIQIVSNTTRVVIRRRDVDWGVVAPFSLLLLPAGALAIPLVLRAPAAVLQLAIAVVVLAATWLPERSDRSIGAPTRLGWVGVGAVMGALNVVVGATGPLQAPLFRAAAASRQRFVGTFAGGQVAGHASKLVLFGVAGLGPAGYPNAAAAGVLGVVVGTWSGSRLLERISEERFGVLYLVAITAVSLYLVADAALDLAG